MAILPPDPINDFCMLVDTARDAKGRFDPLVEEIDSSDSDSYYQLIRKALATDSSGVSTRAFFLLSHSLQLLVNLGEIGSEILSIFSVIIDATRKIEFLTEFSDSVGWKTAIDIARKFLKKSPEFIQFSRPSARSVAVSRSFLRLKDRGYLYQRGPWKPILIPQFEQKLVKEIENLIEKIGGLNVIGNIFRILRNSDRIYCGLILYGRQVSMTDAPRDPSIPWHYLYNLALKYLSKTGVSKNPVEDFRNLIELARDYAATYDVEEYSAFGLSGMSAYSLEIIFRDNTIYDELFSFQQWSYTTSHILLEHWFDAFEATGVKLPEASLSEWKKVTKKIIQVANNDQFSIVDRVSLFCFDVSVESENQILKNFSISTDEVNQNYLYPLHTDKRNSPFFSIFLLKSGQYGVPPKGILSRALYERLMTLIRSNNGNNLDNNLGKSLEIVVDKILKSKNKIPIISGGKYRYPTKKKRWESDFIISSETHIEFIECKKKSLTNRSRAGHLPDAFVDITKGFFDPIRQTSNHEIALLNRQKINFENGESIQLGSRKITRIAITALDYGSFHNKMFVSRLLSALPYIHFKANDVETNEKFKKINPILKELSLNLSALAEFHNQDINSFIHNYAFDTWWLSIDQFHILISSDKTISDSLKMLRNLVYNTGDIMNEFALISQVMTRANKA